MTRSSTVGQEPSNRGIRAWPLDVALAIVATALSLWTWLSAAPLWLDEAMLALNVRDRSLGELSGELWLGQAAPLGWLASEHVLVRLLGDGERALRLLPLMFGIATLALACAIGRRWLSRWSGTLFVFLVAVGQWLAVFRVEAKPYSADVFWALLIPAAAAWAVEDVPSISIARRRWVAWWIVAAVGQWFAYGATFATPACAFVAAAISQRTRGTRHAISCAAFGVTWLVSFGLHYEVALRAAHESAYLRTYWASWLPPSSASLVMRVRWAFGQLGAAAHHPGGAALATPFWITAIVGLIVGKPRALALSCLGLVLTALGLSAAGVVPLFERLSVWLVPALYIGVALAFERGAERGYRPDARLASRAIGFAIAALALLVTLDVSIRGWRRLDAMPTNTANQGMNDRVAAAHIADKRGPDDAVITTRAGWPGLWWYGGIDVATLPADGRLRDGSTMYEVDWNPQREVCRPSVAEILHGHSRVFVYVGFNDLPRELYDRLTNELRVAGSLIEEQTDAPLSRVAVIRLHPQFNEERPQPAPLGTLPTGCLTARPASRW